MGGHMHIKITQSEYMISALSLLDRNNPRSFIHVDIHQTYNTTKQ
jgi:hypothetical protein